MTGLCTGVSTCSAQQVETFCEESSFPSKSNSCLNRMFPRNATVLTTATTTQKCERRPWPRADFAGREGRGCPRNSWMHREQKGFPTSQASVRTEEPRFVLLAFLLEIFHCREIMNSCLGWAAGEMLRLPTLASQVGARAEAPVGQWGRCTFPSPCLEIPVLLQKPSLRDHLASLFYF